MKIFLQTFLFILAPLLSRGQEKLLVANIKLDTQIVTNADILFIKDDSIFAQTMAGKFSKIFIYLQKENTKRSRISADSIKQGDVSDADYKEMKHIWKYIPALSPGKYDIVISNEGFRSKIYKNVVLSFGTNSFPEFSYPDTCADTTMRKKYWSKNYDPYAEKKHCPLNNKDVVYRINYGYASLPEKNSPQDVPLGGCVVDPCLSPRWYCHKHKVCF